MDTYINQKYRIKKLILITLLVMMGSGFRSFSQSNVDDKFSLEVPSIKKEKPFYPKFFINYSFISGLGKYRHGQHYSTPYPPDEVDYMGSDTYESEFPAMKTGFAFEVGNIFWLNSLKLNHGLKIGIYAVYQEFQFLFGRTSDNNHVTHQINSMKVGPILSYNPIGALLIDFRATLEPTVMPVLTENIFIKGGVGLNVRYQRLYVGLNFSFGNVLMSSGYSYQEHSFSNSVMRLTFGLNFLPLKEK